MNRTRNCIRMILACAALFLSLHSAYAAEAAYPTRPIRIIVPFVAGGGTDLLAALPDSPRAHEPFPTLLEYDMSENALRTELAREPIRHSDGIVAVPQSPGLGIEIDREVLAKYC